ncbi:LysR family transcriptional regulator [Leucobacter allii]|uniref:LysR family transcriptional regulator n=1 Tax=Leucobacter allii TaxID=2932247 RepID=UPI001FD03C8E|nr:LysR family transcriptional regulator [Leucobacter allii]UOR03309.1 LysR family transcriptional regulator [Leucobacter allii]
MDHRRLQYFHAVARAGSFSRAAAELHMTQPPLSAAIAQLETDLEARLLVRSSRGVTVTPAGEEVLRYAERLTTQEHELRRRIAAIQSGRLGSLEISCNPILAGTLVPRLIRALTAAEASLDIALHEAYPRVVLEAVQKGEVDVGLVATSASEDLRLLYGDELEVHRLAAQEMIALLPPEYAHLPDPVSLRDIARFEFASPANSMRHGIRFGLLDAFEFAKLPRPRVREVPSMQEAIPLITAGLAAGIMPEAIRGLVHPDRVTMRHIVDGPEPFEISLVFRRDRAHLPAIARFRETAFAEIGDAG